MFGRVVPVLLDRRLNVVPDGWAGIVERQKELGLLRDVFEIAHERCAIFARFEMLMVTQVFALFEEFGQAVLKFPQFMIVPFVELAFCSVMPAPCARPVARGIRDRAPARCNFRTF